jgi:hypothetical protein
MVTASVAQVVSSDSLFGAQFERLKLLRLVLYLLSPATALVFWHCILARFRYWRVLLCGAATCRVLHCCLSSLLCCGLLHQGVLNFSFLLRRIVKAAVHRTQTAGA